ncbi:MAG: DUF362 domain-containing protein [Thermoflexales bacterium]|nr:DUF362 domain-containing protein [Thermoflexales bacterium]
MPKLSRREFLRGAAVAGATATFGGLSPQWLRPAATRLSPAALRPGRVVHLHSSSATSWTGQSNYWDYVNQAKVDEMIDHGLMVLTGTATVAEAWRTLLPNYQVGQGIAIKVNFNNSLDCNGSLLIDAVPEPINALIRGLKLRGVAEDDIWLYDAGKAIPTRFYNGCDYRTGVRFYDNGCHLPVTFDSQQASATITFNPHPGDPQPPVTKVADVLVNATYLINVPLLKFHGTTSSGVSLSFKQHWGSIDGPLGLHDYIFVTGPYRHPDYNALLDVYNNLNIRGKTILTVADGLFGSINGYDKPPSLWTTFGNQAPNSLLLSVDPVALDCVLCDLLEAELSELPAGTDSYLPLAQQVGLGVFERGQPWGSGYRSIDYQRLEADAQVATLNLASGWNLLSLPLNPIAPYTAQSALADITAQGGNSTEIDRWFNSGWNAYIRGLPFNNFAVTSGAGFFFKSTQASSWPLTGYAIQQASALALSTGWNLIALPVSAPLTASSLLADINAQGGACTEIDRWWNGGWNAFIGGLPFNNFAIENGRGYFVKCAAPSTYVP